MVFVISVSVVAAVVLIGVISPAGLARVSGQLLDATVSFPMTVM